MQNLETDKIIGIGLITALVLKITGDIVVTLYGMNVPAADLATNIVSGLVGYMGRSLLDKMRQSDNNDRRS